MIATARNNTAKNLSIFISTPLENRISHARSKPFGARRNCLRHLKPPGLSRVTPRANTEIITAEGALTLMTRHTA
jgi:hypothetical protein